MKKYTFIFIAILSIITFVFVISFYNKFECEILNETIQEHVISYADLNNFGIERKLYNENVKLVTVRCNVKNHSYRKLDFVYIKFDDNSRSSSSVLSKKIDTGLPWPISLKPFSEKTVEFKFLIDNSAKTSGLKIDFVRETFHENKEKLEFLFDVIL